MQLKVIPNGLVKKLKGETFRLKLIFPTKLDYEVEAYANFNDETKYYQFEKTDNGYELKVPLLRSGIYTYTMRWRRAKTKRWHWRVDNNHNRILGTLHVDPAWLSQAIVYNVFVRFFKGKGERSGTFDDVKAHLDELKKMHVSVLYLNPVHLIGELYRGYSLSDPLPTYLQPGSPYSIKDYKSIDPELTVDKDSSQFAASDPQQEFADLVEAAHERGMFVFMDLVFNHTAHDFVLQRMRPEWYLYKENITSLSDPYLYPEDIEQGKPWGDPKHSMAPYDHDVWWSDCAQLNWEYRLPKAINDPPANYSLKEMWAYFKGIPQYWIKRFGVDGFRCDVAYRVPPAFWQECIQETRLIAKQLKNNMSHDVAFVAESYSDDLVSLQEAGFSAVYGEFSFKLRNPQSLAGYLDYIYNKSGHFFPTGSRWFHFPESHDFGRAAERFLGPTAINDPEAITKFNRSRWLLTALLPGIPLIFNGFEYIEWKPINIMSYGLVSWQSRSSLKEFIEKVNSIRLRLPAFQKGSFSAVQTNQGLNEKTQLFAFLREYKQEIYLVVVNMDVYQKAGPVLLNLDERFKGKYQLYDLLADKLYQREGTELAVILEPGDGHVFQVRDFGKAERVAAGVTA